MPPLRWVLGTSFFPMFKAFRLSDAKIHLEINQYRNFTIWKVLFWVKEIEGFPTIPLSNLKSKKWKFPQKGKERLRSFKLQGIDSNWPFELKTEKGKKQ